MPNVAAPPSRRVSRPGSLHKPDDALGRKKQAAAPNASGGRHVPRRAPRRAWVRVASANHFFFFVVGFFAAAAFFGAAAGFAAFFGAAAFFSVFGAAARFAALSAAPARFVTDW